jgi:hypothetical protein
MSHAVPKKRIGEGERKRKHVNKLELKTSGRSTP